MHVLEMTDWRCCCPRIPRACKVPVFLLRQGELMVPCFLQACPLCSMKTAIYKISEPFFVLRRPFL